MIRKEKYKIGTGEDMEKINASITVNREFVKGEIDRRINGSFEEHMGRVVYSGRYEPGHETAD